MSEKLTMAQRAYLSLLSREPRVGLNSYRPAATLIRLGLAKRGRRIGLQNCEYRITDAGQQWLADRGHGSRAALAARGGERG